MNHSQKKENVVLVDRWYYEVLDSLASETPPQYPELPMSVLVNQLIFKFRKKAFAKENVRHSYYNNMPITDARCTALLSHLKQRKAAGQRSVALLAPHPQNPTLSPSDGYMRRVAAIDKAVFEDDFRVYIYDSPYWNVDVPRCEFYGEGSFEITFNGRYASHREFVRSLVENCSICYIHSVHRLFSPTAPEREEYLLNPFGIDGVRYILDMHGTVPLELELAGQAEAAATARMAERLCFENADAVVAVNEVSAGYVFKQYPDFCGEYIVCPLFDCINEGGAIDKQPVKIVIYAGGNQEWQLIPEMITAMETSRNSGLNYDILINGVTEEEKERIGAVEGASVGSVSATEVLEHYRKAHFGFMLRDNTDINRYSAPTKLFEYLSFGVIPILKSTEIGDFVNLGMKYLSVNDFVNAPLPSQQEMSAIAEHNVKVLDVISDMGRNGVKKLSEFCRA